MFSAVTGRAVGHRNTMLMKAVQRIAHAFIAKPNLPCKIWLSELLLHHPVLLLKVELTIFQGPGFHVLENILQAIGIQYDQSRAMAVTLVIGQQSCTDEVKSMPLLEDTGNGSVATKSDEIDGSAPTLVRRHPEEASNIGEGNIPKDGNPDSVQRSSCEAIDLRPDAASRDELITREGKDRSGKRLSRCKADELQDL
jgi:hypothetical protein